MKPHTLKVAVTGSIGSGKSAFCKFLAEKGYLVINADDLAKEILASDEKIKSKIIKEFGKASYKDDKVNKKFLADKVFSLPGEVRKINSIIHPKVTAEIKKIFSDLEGTEEIIFVEAALIYEADMEDMFDHVVLVTADETIRRERKTNNDNMSEEEFGKRNSNQIPDSEKKKRAEFIFENNSSPDELMKKAELFLTLLPGLK